MLRDLINHMRGHWHTTTSYLRTGPSPWASQANSWERGWDTAANATMKPIGSLFKNLAMVPLGALAVGGMLGALGAETAIRATGRLVLGRSLAAYSAAGGVVGIGSAASMLAGGLGFMALDALKLTEGAFRAVMTGSPIAMARGAGFMASNPLDAYFPFAKQSVHDVGLAKFAPNPSLIRRAVGLSFATAGIRAFAGELFSPNAPMPSIYVDAAGNTRHRSDWGADAKFGASMMGQSSVFNMSRNDLLRLAMYT